MKTRIKICITIFFVYVIFYITSNKLYFRIKPIVIYRLPEENQCRTGVCLPDNVKRYNNSKSPHFLIFGSKKSGTRALHMFLSSHPSVVAPNHELHFFDDDQRYELGYQWYRSQFPEATNGELVFEKTPAYIFKAGVERRVYSFNKSIKLIATLRDPINRLLGDYAQLQSNRKSNQKPPLPRFQDFYIDYKSQSLKDRTEVRVGMYSVHLARWLRYFPRSQIHIVDGEKLVKDPLPLLQGIERFLGIDLYFNEKNVYFNKTRGFYCCRGNCLGKNKGRPHAEVSDSDLAIMTSFYRPYNEQLFKLLNQTFDWLV